MSNKNNMLMRFVLVGILLIMGSAVEQQEWSCEKNGVNEKYMVIGEQLSN